MEGAAGGGGGDGLASGAAHASDLDILRDNPAPPGTGVQRGGFVVGTCGDLHKSPPGETRNGDCSLLHSPKCCVRHCPRPLTVVKWYRIDGY